MQTHKKLALACFALLPLAGHAQTSAEQISNLTQQTAILNAQKAKLDAEKGVLQVQDDIAKLRNSQGTMDRPVLKAIEGIDGKLVATLVSNGGIQNVRKGDKTHDGWQIIQIDARSVLIGRGTEQARLTFGSDTYSGDQQAGIGTTKQPQRANGGPYPIPQN